MATNATARARPRVIATEAKTPTAEMKSLAKNVFEYNTKMNAAKREHDKNRKELYAKMKEAQITEFTSAVQVPKKGLTTLEISVSTPTSVRVDIAKLAKLVDRKTFLQIISATQTSVKEYCGDVIVQQCTYNEDGKENVYVAPAK